MWKPPDLAMFTDHRNHSIEREPKNSNLEELLDFRHTEHQKIHSGENLKSALAVRGASFVHTFIDTNIVT